MIRSAKEALEILKREDAFAARCRNESPGADGIAKDIFASLLAGEFTRLQLLREDIAEGTSTAEGARFVLQAAANVRRSAASLRLTLSKRPITDEELLG